MTIGTLVMFLGLVAATVRAQFTGKPDGEFIEDYLAGCWKDAYGRGVGSIPDACPNADKNGQLCYPYCKEGYTGVGPVCWQNCPSGYRDDGAYCFKPSAYERGVGYTSEGSCANSHSQGCEKWGLIWYPKCAAGYYAFGCCVCSPQCPSGMTDIGVSCAKHSYGRTAGYPTQCASHLEYDAGLCYPKCEKKYDGIGPLCWSKCPSRIWKYECGALCLNEDGLCTDKVLSLIKDAVDLLVQVLKTLDNPTEDQFKLLLKESLNTATGYVYPLCSERFPKRR